MTKLEEARNLFESIICMCAEGREVVACEHLLDAIQEDAEKGYEIIDNICQKAQKRFMEKMAKEAK